LAGHENGRLPNEIEPISKVPTAADEDGGMGMEKKNRRNVMQEDLSFMPLVVAMK